MGAALPIRRWSDLLLGWRDRLVASAAFRRRAAAFPLTRPLARANAARLFDLCSGFVYSQTLVAAIRLRLPERLAAAPQDGATLAAQLGLTTQACSTLLEATGAIGLTTQRRDGRHALGTLGAALVRNEALAALVEHHAHFYADLADPVALLRGERKPTALGRYWAYARNGDAGALSAAEVAPYTALMGASQTLVADEVLAAVDLRAHRVLLDIGGGNGAFLRAVAKRHPHLQLMLFDLPPVAEAAAARFAVDGLSARSRVHGGDFHRDALPTGADIASLVRVLHDHDDDAALALLRAAHAALPANGRLIVAEPLSGTPGAPSLDAYFGFYLLAMGQGRLRTRADLATMLHSAGFGRLHWPAARVPLVASVVVAGKAG